LRERRGRLDAPTKDLTSDTDDECRFSNSAGAILAAVDDAGARRRRVVRLQKYLLNPPTKAAVYLGLIPGHALIETTGRKTGKRRRTVVGVHHEDDTLWVVAEQGRYAGYVRNVEANPRVRVRYRRRWLNATGQLLDDDDAVDRVRSFGREGHARLVTTMGTSLLTLRFDLDK
jgi:deazaflavin-dependent oxidoreductase (nitroreductase family)